MPRNRPPIRNSTNKHSGRRTKTPPIDKARKGESSLARQGPVIEFGGTQVESRQQMVELLQRGDLSLNCYNPAWQKALFQAKGWAWSERILPNSPAQARLIRKQLGEI